MYCTNCGVQMNVADRFCARCGQAAGGSQTSAPFAPQEPLSRDVANKKVAGVCAGIARRLGWDVTIVRVVFIAAILFKGIGLLAYLIGWVCMPTDNRRVYGPVQPAG